MKFPIGKAAATGGHLPAASRRTKQTEEHIMYKRILAIGDIHGEYDKLVDLYAKIDFNPPDDLLVFLGDYVDRGKKPIEVLQWLMARRDEPNVVMLRGNHDQMMLDCYFRKEVQQTWGGPFAPEDHGDVWKENGGNKTHNALNKSAWRLAAEAGKPNDAPTHREIFRKRCLEFCRFIAGLPLFHQVEVGGRTYFFCHAGIRPGVPPAEQNPEDLLWIRPESFLTKHLDSHMVVAGHTQVGGIRRWLGMEPGLAPVILDNMIFLDTAACEGGPLFCVDVLSGREWQSD